MRNIPFSPPDITELEIQEVCEALRSGWITTGPRTKQLEKDFGNAAYATIRGFVLKFEKLGLLRSVKYGNRIKYQINWSDSSL